ncbi:MULTISPECIES: hypothetical protein [Thermodesulfovibrio]|jgi:hypothetical protein|uniref:hypothetical protein n=1 Tax=Thermodesulfovibrio TaxID=28261 RepID=UPI002620AE2C|nr:hypothetical protein [Thermodesulfovibrio sp.]
MEEYISLIDNLAEKYNLKIFHLDFSDFSLIARIGLSLEIFIQIYINTRKQKTNLALVISDIRVYGIDKEGGFYHEHPFENPDLHLPAEPMEIEDFIIKSLEYLEKMGLI